MMVAAWVRTFSSAGVCSAISGQRHPDRSIYGPWPGLILAADNWTSAG